MENLSNDSILLINDSHNNLENMIGRSINYELFLTFSVKNAFLDMLAEIKNPKNKKVLKYYFFSFI